MTTIVYHKNCMDGYGAAWALSKLHPAADFIAADYQTLLPKLYMEEVIFADFSVTREVALTMIENGNTLVFLDHHKSAIEDLKELPPNEDIDISRCTSSFAGCEIAYRYALEKGADLSPEMPKVLMHIADRDLWRFEMSGSKEVAAELYDCVNSIDDLDKIVQGGSQVLQRLVKQGLLRHSQFVMVCERIIKNQTFYAIVNGREMPVVNCPRMYASEIGNMLVKDSLYNASMTFNYRSYDEVNCSLRGDGGVDVSEIAKSFGGGGHANAAGFSLTPKAFYEAFMV